MEIPMSRLGISAAVEATRSVAEVARVAAAAGEGREGAISAPPEIGEVSFRKVAYSTYLLST